jgi:hypothetical protein
MTAKVRRQKPRWPRRRHRYARDEGIGMITVMGLSSSIAIVVALSVTVAINSLASARGHVEFESALATAETGIDEILGDIQTAYDNGVNYTPANADCTASWGWSNASMPGPAAEKAWLEAAVAAMPEECIKSAGRGQYVAFRAKAANGSPIPVVYSVGWTNTAADASENRQRAVRVEYLFSPYKPNQAILTESNLVFSGSVEVDLANDSGATSADVHSNANLVAGNNSLKVNGNVTASGTNDKAGTCPDGKITGTCEAAAPPQAVPKVNVRSLYRALAPSTSAGWFDLCPDGTVRAPDLTNFTAPTPCTGTVLSPSGTYRGWVLEDAGTVDATWVFKPVDGTDYPGAYYAYQTHVSLEKGKGNKNQVTMSVMVEAEQNGRPSYSATCNKSGGILTWKHGYITNYLPGVLFVADTAVIGEANSDVGTGVIAAGDYVDWNTSSSLIKGSMVSSGNCPTSPTNIIQGVELRYDSSSEVPLSTLIRTTGWMEMVG